MDFDCECSTREEKIIRDCEEQIEEIKNEIEKE